MYNTIRKTKKGIILSGLILLITSFNLSADYSLQLEGTVQIPYSFKYHIMQEDGTQRFYNVIVDEDSIGFYTFTMSEDLVFSDYTQIYTEPNIHNFECNFPDCYYKFNRVYIHLPPHDSLSTVYVFEYEQYINKLEIPIMIYINSLSIYDENTILYTGCIHWSWGQGYNYSEMGIYQCDILTGSQEKIFDTGNQLYCLNNDYMICTMFDYDPNVYSYYAWFLFDNQLTCIDTLYDPTGGFFYELSIEGFVSFNNTYVLRFFNGIFLSGFFTIEIVNSELILQNIYTFPDWESLGPIAKFTDNTLIFIGVHSNLPSYFGITDIYISHIDKYYLDNQNCPILIDYSERLKIVYQQEDNPENIIYFYFVPVEDNPQIQVITEDIGQPLSLWGHKLYGNRLYMKFGVYIYKYIVGDSTSGEDNFFEKPRISLECYPNPFNPAVTIKYNLLKYNDVQLSIYNIKGERVKVLVDDYISKGTHKIIWNGKDNTGNPVGIGVYLYQLKLDNKIIETKKMVLTK